MHPAFSIPVLCRQRAFKSIEAISCEGGASGRRRQVFPQANKRSTNPDSRGGRSSTRKFPAIIVSVRLAFTIPRIAALKHGTLLTEKNETVPSSVLGRHAMGLPLAVMQLSLAAGK